MYACVCLLSQHHEPMDISDRQRSVTQLSVAMGNITMVLKGEQDLITDGGKGKCQDFSQYENNI